MDQLVAGGGASYRAASEVSLARKIVEFVERGSELQRAAAVRASKVRTMDEHFSELFARYEGLAPHRVPTIVPEVHAMGAAAPEFALARSTVITRR